MVEFWAAWNFSIIYCIFPLSWMFLLFSLVQVIAARLNHSLNCDWQGNLFLHTTTPYGIKKLRSIVSISNNCYYSLCFRLQSIMNISYISSYRSPHIIPKYSPLPTGWQFVIITGWEVSPSKPMICWVLSRNGYWKTKSWTLWLEFKQLFK